ncbi:gas vesicle protein K [Desulfofundulus sp. TPOSR]|uniref:gas vesicle protein K n=1 Tax=Desulfofundulus sp. TPOSR TaxID=2714340 RepID=UPI00140E430D|nr:gas vesicle protein K [Desulfofundulus sp. TPOSR]NHM26758.1 gas vesicle protein K [Desulfofundulus sp. TPOSR]
MVPRNVESDPDALEEFIDELQGQQVNQPRINVDPEKIEQGLAKLVLTLIELLRKLMEKQALKRMEAGSLTSEEIERMGLTFMRLEEKMEELKQLFGLKDEDLNLKLGPLGDLM